MRAILCSDKKVSLVWASVTELNQDDIRGDDPTPSDGPSQHEGVAGQTDRVRVQDLLGDRSPQVASQAEVSWWEILLR